MKQYNPLTADANLSDLLGQLKQNIFTTLNCHAHATVISFDPIKQTITATVNYKKTVYISQAPGQLPTPTAVSYSPITNCPVFFLPGFTSPILPGMQTLIAFNDRDMDNYLAAQVVTTSQTGRQHSFSDAFAFVGMGVPSAPLSNFDMLRVAMTYQGTKVGVSSAGVLLQAHGIKLSTALTSLVSALTAFMTACEGSVVDPVLVTAATAAFAAINAAKLEIVAPTGVLE
jgi:hypothetical protein